MTTPATTTAAPARRRGEWAYSKEGDVVVLDHPARIENLKHNLFADMAQGIFRRMAEDLFMAAIMPLVEGRGGLVPRSEIVRAVETLRPGDIGYGLGIPNRAVRPGEAPLITAETAAWWDRNDALQKGCALADVQRAVRSAAPSAWDTATGRFAVDARTGVWLPIHLARTEWPDEFELRRRAEEARRSRRRRWMFWRRR
jgi:hypothetical protein